MDQVSKKRVDMTNPVDIATAAMADDSEDTTHPPASCSAVSILRRIGSEIIDVLHMVPEMAFIVVLPMCIPCIQSMILKLGAAIGFGPVGTVSSLILIVSIIALNYKRLCFYLHGKIERLILFQMKGDL
jgi:hypothetical protein